MNLLYRSADYEKARPWRYEDAILKMETANAEQTNYDTRRDEMLAIRCQLGEPAAFEALISQWAPTLHRYLLRITGDTDATQDLLQEIWLSVLRGISALADCAKLRSWLFSIAHRCVMDRLRSQYRAQIDPDIALEQIVDENSELAHADTRSMVLDGLAMLPMAEREVLSLFYLQELSLAEIASVIEVPVGTVKSRLFRARKLLRGHFTTS